MAGGARGTLGMLLGLAVACGGKSASPPPPATTEQGTAPTTPTPPAPPATPTPPPPPTIEPPVVVGDWSFYGQPQLLTDTVNDASADEAGNVYLAGGDAVYAKRRSDRDFVRFDADAAGLTKNCHDASEIKDANPTSPLRTCPIISVAGATPGKAVIGYQGVGTDNDYDGPWALDSGGADVLAFDGTALTRERHVLVASPPGVICEHWANPPTNTVCNETWIDSTWMSGRKKLRQVLRIVVNHDRRRSVSYGDVLMGGTHATISVLVANPGRRGWVDATKGDPAWADAEDVWEHEHPALSWPDGRFLTGEGHAIAIDPTTNVPWFANEFRIARLPGYASMSHPSWNGWWGELDPPYPYLWIWQSEGSPDDATRRDNVVSLSFCDDGTLWIGSAGQGLARRAPDGTVSFVGLPAAAANQVSAVACDKDGSAWVGFGWGGVARYRSGAWESLPAGAPGFTHNTVANIQIDRWSSPRVVYVAFVRSAQGVAGGVAAYSGP